MTAWTIGSAARSDVPAVADLIANAFHSLPACEWLVPDPTHRAVVLAGQFAILVKHALTYEIVATVRDDDGVAGAAVWLDYTRDIPAPPDYHTRLAAACGPYTDRFTKLDELFEANHPARPHHHLAFLAVRPDRQGHGIGTALLEHHHDLLDRYAIAGYLEASSHAAREFYLHRGWHLLTDPFVLPNGATFWPMWRQPAPAP